MDGQRIGEFREPGAIGGQLQDFSRAKVFVGIRRWIPKRTQQTFGHENGNIVRLTVKDPSRLLNRQPGWRTGNETQESILVILHGIILFWGRPAFVE